MNLCEINFDGIVGPSHNYAGLSLGNLASTRNAGAVSQPRAAALQGLDKMRANVALGLAQGVFLPHPRPDRRWLAELGTTIEEADPILAANALSASAMWAANAATVSPAQLSSLRSDPAVAEVVPNSLVHLAPPTTGAAGSASGTGTTPLPGACAPPGQVQLEPEALKTMSVDSDNPNAKTARSLGISSPMEPARNGMIASATAPRFGRR